MQHGNGHLCPHDTAFESPSCNNSHVPMKKYQTTRLHDALHIIVHDKSGILMFANSPCPRGTRQIVHEDCGFVAIRCRFE